MSTCDWEARYQSGDMPWEKGEPSPGLVDWLTTFHQLPPGRSRGDETQTFREPGDQSLVTSTATAQGARSSVAVPGCGTGHDVRLWARAGFEAWGFDLAPSAIELARQRTAAAELNARFTQSDFLSDAPPQTFDWLFEHTLFCAIDPSRRDDYVRAVLRWLKPGGQLLAVHYMLRDCEGPPFAVSQEELMERFTPHFELKQGWVPRSYPNRTGQELMLWWRRKAG